MNKTYTINNRKCEVEIHETRTIESESQDTHTSYIAYVYDQDGYRRYVADCDSVRDARETLRKYLYKA